MKEIQNSPDINWNNLEEEIDNAINEDNQYIAFKIIEIEECKYIQKVAEAKLSKLNDTINRIIFFVALGFSFMLPFIYENKFDIFSVILIAFILIFFKIYHSKSFVKGLLTSNGFFSGVISGLILALVFLIARLFFYLADSIGFFIGFSICIFSIDFYKKVVLKQYDTCNKIILNAERKILWMEADSKRARYEE